jgi:hypothetical protein
LDLKVAYPEAPFKDKHIHYNIDIMAANGIIRRSHVLEDGKLMITYEDAGKNPKFKQGRKNYPKVK